MLPAKQVLALRADVCVDGCAPLQFAMYMCRWNHNTTMSDDCNTNTIAMHRPAWYVKPAVCLIPGPCAASCTRAGAGGPLPVFLPCYAVCAFVIVVARGILCFVGS